MCNNMKKYLFVVFGILIILFILYLILSSIKDRSVNEPPQPSPIPTSEPSASQPLPTNVKSRSNGKILINNVELRDFFIFSKKINENGDVLISQSENYNIEYFPKFNSFLISIKASPFEENRKLAEQELINKLGINKNDACRLPINVATTQEINPEFSGRNYPLSFCHSY